jgi:hypothetical protein
VKRYRDADMAVRWAAAGFLEAEKNFRKILGVSELWVLAAALKRPTSTTNIDHDRKVASPMPHPPSQPSTVFGILPTAVEGDEGRFELFRTRHGRFLRNVWGKHRAGDARCA